MNEEITVEVREKVLIDFFKYVAQNVSLEDLPVNSLVDPIEKYLKSINEASNESLNVSLKNIRVLRSEEEGRVYELGGRYC